MNRSVAFNKFGGLYVYQDTLDFLQRAYTEVTQYMSRGLGDKWVLSGCTEAGGLVADGSIVIGTEILNFVGGPQLAYITIETIVTQEQFDDNTLKDTYTVRRAKMVNIPDANSFAYALLKRLPLTNSSVYDSIDKYHKILKSIINFEPEVILNGLLVTNVTTGPDTFDVSAGLVMFNGQIKSVPAFSGAYPQYLTEAGTWSAVAPGAGLYITFDPYTSQYYTDVLKRAMTSVGEIKMFETLSDRFVNGIGQWEMKGFELMVELQARVPIGLWFDGNAEANVTDVLYENAGAQGGENKHSLTSGENGPHYHETGTETDDTAPVAGKFRRGAAHNQRAWGGAPSTTNFPSSTDLSGSGTAHENRQPFTVVVYAKRV